MRKGVRVVRGNYEYKNQSIRLRIRNEGYFWLLDIDARGRYERTTRSDAWIIGTSFATSSGDNFQLLAGNLAPFSPTNFAPVSISNWLILSWETQKFLTFQMMATFPPPFGRLPFIQLSSVVVSKEEYWKNVEFSAKNGGNTVKLEKKMSFLSFLKAGIINLWIIEGKDDVILSQLTHQLTPNAKPTQRQIN